MLQVVLAVASLHSPEAPCKWVEPAGFCDIDYPISAAADVQRLQRRVQTQFEVLQPALAGRGTCRDAVRAFLCYDAFPGCAAAHAAQAAQAARPGARAEPAFAVHCCRELCELAADAEIMIS